MKVVKTTLLILVCGLTICLHNSCDEKKESEEYFIDEWVNCKMLTKFENSILTEYSWNENVQTYTYPFQTVNTYNEYGYVTNSKHFGSDSTLSRESILQYKDKWKLVSWEYIEDGYRTFIIYHNWNGNTDEWEWGWMWDQKIYYHIEYNDYGKILFKTVHDFDHHLDKKYEAIYEDGWRIVLEKKYFNENNYNEIIHSWDGNEEFWEDEDFEYRRFYNSHWKVEKFEKRNKITEEIQTNEYTWDCSGFEPIYP